jgi:hypothetical protein
MFSKSQIGSVVENGIYGIVAGAVVVSWILPAFGLDGLSPWIGGIVGGVLGVVYGFAKD